MRRDQFVEARRARWARLETLVERGNRSGLRRLTGDEVLELGRLYRVATSDLAIAQRDFPHDRVTVYLNGLVARAHPFIYREQVADLARIARFVRYGFPAAYRAAGPYIALAFAASLLAALVSGLLVAVHPSLADVFMPGQAQELRSVMAQHQLWMKGNTANHPLAANFIMLNNIKVAFLAFAGGMLLGLGSLFILILNGINLGVVAALVAQYGLSRPFWAFVVPHGVIELSVIFMAGGAGIMIGDAILRPGLRRRRDAVVAAGRQAAYILFGCVPLLIIAGTIEGFFSASDAPDIAKYAVGLLSGLLLYAYLLGSRPPQPPPLYSFEDITTESAPEPSISALT